MKVSLFVAGGLALAFALPAAAAPRINVPVKDLDFSKPADVSAYNTRLDAAAKKACRGESPMLLDANRRFVRCDVLVKQEALARLPEASRTALASLQPAEGVATM
jgi:UrcA family protein